MARDQCIQAVLVRFLCELILAFLPHLPWLVKALVELAVWRYKYRRARKDSRSIY